MALACALTPDVVVCFIVARHEARQERRVGVRPERPPLPAHAERKDERQERQRRKDAQQRRLVYFIYGIAARYQVVVAAGQVHPFVVGGRLPVHGESPQQQVRQQQRRQDGRVQKAPPRRRLSGRRFRLAGLVFHRRVAAGG